MAKYVWLGIVLILLLPAILFSFDYLASGGSFAGPTRQNSIAESGLGWAATVTVRHPAHVVTGQKIPVNVTVGITLTNQSVTVQLNSLVAQLRSAARLNSTTNQVLEWSVLSSATKRLNLNLTSSGQRSAVLQLEAFYPPSAGLLDQIAPSAKMAVNGLVNMTVYAGTGNQSSVTFTTVSILDDRPFYQNQLATITSQAAWFDYQLLAIVGALLVYAIWGKPMTLPVDQTYLSKIEAYVAERKLAYLEELKNSGKISEAAYSDLKLSYEKEVANPKRGLGQ